ncbi:carbohydrate sulfotransferase 12-like isoform X2 [Convolutriloba macropyga]
MQHNYYFNYSRTYKNYHILATNSIPSYNWSLSRLGPATVPTRKRDIKKLENNLLSITDFEKVFPKNGTYPFDVESRLKNSIDIQKLRLWNLEKFCAGTSYKFDTDLEIPSLTLFPGTKVFECRVPKTGSSTRGAIFWPIFHKSSTDTAEKNYIHPMDDRDVRKTTQLMWKSTFARSYPFGFMFVREPFERAVSGYYNRIVERHKMKGYETEHMTLKSYIKILISGGTDDQHFKTQIRTCDPCFLKIGFLGRKETLSEDMLNVVNNATNLHSLITFNESSKYYSDKVLETKNYNLTKDILSLDKNLIKQFIWMYRLDYLAFGYNPYKLLNYF